MNLTLSHPSRRKLFVDFLLASSVFILSGGVSSESFLCLGVCFNWLTCSLLGRTFRLAGAVARTTRTSLCVLPVLGPIFHPNSCTFIWGSYHWIGLFEWLGFYCMLSHYPIHIHSRTEKANR
uniref:Uncharacterized protein n=1 Tax=Cacopsylla melanoneura TaxID=428564 RepID=A0A8D8W5W1_9HEMI